MASTLFEKHAVHSGKKWCQLLLCLQAPPEWIEEAEAKARFLSDRCAQDKIHANVCKCRPNVHCKELLRTHLESPDLAAWLILAVLIFAVLSLANMVIGVVPTRKTL